MCGDATNWDEDAYRESVLKEREIQTQTVFRTAWAPSPSQTPNINSLIVASSDGSIASYSIPSLISASKVKNPFDFINTNTDKLLAEPDCFFQAHEGPAYDVKFYGDDEDALLLSCGDDGRIRGWRWKELTSSKYSVSSEGNDIKPILDVVNPQHNCRHYVFWYLPDLKPVREGDYSHNLGPWGALSPIPENNAIAVNTQEGSVFAASGDTCAYCWDVETGKVKMVFKGHLDYLHCIVARNSCNQIITGSEDGTTRIWDCKSGKCTQVIDPAKHLKLKGPASWVGCVALDASESWLACSSGRNISLWNLPASECTLKIPTRASVQDMLFDNNQDSGVICNIYLNCVMDGYDNGVTIDWVICKVQKARIGALDAILTVGADPLLNRFDMNGVILSQIPCAPPSAFSISLHPTGVMAVGGYGCLVDVISQFGSHMCTFRCQCV